MDWVASQAAKHTADAGNKLVSTEEADQKDATLCAAESRKYLNCWEVMNLLRNPDFKLESIVMKPRPLTETADG